MAEETIRLARYAAELRYEDLPAPVVQQAKDCIIDTVAAGICGSALPWSRIVIDYAERTGPGGKCRILGRGGPAVQAPAAALANGALAHAFELDSLTRPGAGAHPGATVLPPALALAQEQRRRRPGVDRRLRRRQRGDDPDRPRHRPHQRGARLSCAGHDRPVRWRGCGRPFAAARCEGDDQCARHRRVVVRRSARIRPRRRWNGQAAASRTGFRSRCPGGQSRRGRFCRATHRPRRRVRVSPRVLHEMGRGRADPRPRQGLRRLDDGIEALSVPRHRPRRGQGGARSTGRGRLYRRRGRGDYCYREPAHGRAPQHLGARRSDVGAIQHPVLSCAGAMPRGARPRILGRDGVGRPADPRALPPSAVGAW